MFLKIKNIKMVYGVVIMSMVLVSGYFVIKADGLPNFNFLSPFKSEDPKIPMLEALKAIFGIDFYNAVKQAKFSIWEIHLETPKLTEEFYAILSKSSQMFRMKALNIGLKMASHLAEFLQADQRKMNFNANFTALYENLLALENTSSVTRKSVERVMEYHLGQSIPDYLKDVQKSWHEDNKFCSQMYEDFMAMANEAYKDLDYNTTKSLRWLQAKYENLIIKTISPLYSILMPIFGDNLSDYTKMPFGTTINLYSKIVYGQALQNFVFFDSKFYSSIINAI